MKITTTSYTKRLRLNDIELYKHKEKSPQNKRVFNVGRIEWTRTTDPHLIRVVL